VRAITLELEEWLAALGDAGELDVTVAFRRLATSVAARALVGEDFLRRLGPQFHELFRFLMEGIDFVLPPNLPLPRFRRRDRAKAGLLDMIGGAVAERRAGGEERDDFLQAMVEARDPSGRPFPDRLIA